MSVSPPTDDLRATIADAAHRLRSAAQSAGLTAFVPTCPDWTVTELLAHQGMVHRWARATVAGVDAPFASDADVLERVAPADLYDWFDDGAAELVETLAAAPADLDAWVFMETGRTPLEFWTRRQAHETTVHAVDAIAARHGAVPPAADLDIDPALAADGLDELLVRFAPRGRSKLYDGSPLRIVVTATDTGDEWTLSVGEHALEATTGATVDDPDAHWTGTAAQLYLGLWNRGDEIAVTGDASTLDRWRSRHRIR